MVYNKEKVNGGSKGKYYMEHDETDGVSIGDFLRYLLKKWVLVVSLTLSAAALAVIYSCLQPANYKSSAQIVVVGDNKQQDSSRDIILSNYIALFTSNLVLDKVQDETGIAVDNLRENIMPAREKTSEIITIHYTSTESDKAPFVINSTIKSFGEVVTEMYDVPKNGVNVVSSATDSGVPTNKNMLTPTIMSAAGGFALAMVIAFLRFDAEARDDTKAKNALLRLAQADLQNINTQIAIAKNKLADAEKQVAETETEKLKKMIVTVAKTLSTHTPPPDHNAQTTAVAATSAQQAYDMWDYDWVG